MDDSAKCPSRYNWPQQFTPKKQAWALWRNFLRYSLSLTKDELLSPLGMWYCHLRTIENGALFNPITKELYVITQNIGTKYNIHDEQRQTFSPDGTQRSTSCEGFPVEIEPSETLIKVKRQMAPMEFAMRP